VVEYNITDPGVYSLEVNRTYADGDDHCKRYWKFVHCSLADDITSETAIVAAHAVYLKNI